MALSVIAVTRRVLSRSLLGCALAAGLAASSFVSSPHARAFEAWCADDPVVSVNGHLLDVQVQMPLADLLTMRSTTLTIVIPANLSGAVVVDDVSAFPMKTVVSASGPAWYGAGAIPVTVNAFVSASSVYTTRVVATPVLNLKQLLPAAQSASGPTNSHITLPFNVPN